MNQTQSKSTLISFYQHFMPQGTGALTLIQIFSTLSFSVISSTLILYLTNTLHMDDLLATSITGSFIALNYFLHLLGGYIGGRYFSYRSLFTLGMMLQVAGCALIAVPHTEYLLWGLATFLTGAGTNVTCINCMVTQIFKPHDKRREIAFLCNYSGMNIGFLIGFSMSGYFHLTQNYQQLFLLASIANIFAVLLTAWHWKILKDRDTNFVKLDKPKKIKTRIIGLNLLIALIFTTSILLRYTIFCNQLIMFIGIVMLGVLISLSIKQKKPSARKKMQAFIILTLASLVFWSLYQLVYMGINLFLERNVDRHLFGFVIAPQWIQNINTIVIIIGGPVLGFVFSRLRDRGVNITLPFQFSFALLLIGLGYLALPIGISYANALGYVNFYWVALYFVLQSIGELFISPIGYAMIGQLAPIHLRGLMMGTWMMVIGVSSILSDHFSKMALGATQSIDPVITNVSYGHTFGIMGASSVIFAILLFTCVPLITRLTAEKKLARIKNLKFMQKTA